MTDPQQYEKMFSGVIGKDYDMLKLICPLSVEMSRLVGEAVEDYGRQHQQTIIETLEIGGGTGITTLAALSADQRVKVVSVDNELTMQDQAKQHLAQWVEQQRLSFIHGDALQALSDQASASYDLIVSAYTLHNFESAYREQAHREIFRVLKPGGKFINGDRYGLNDISLHTQTIQQEVAGYFKVLIAEQRLDLLEHWIIHLFSDESENHVMRESHALKQLSDAGFSHIQLSNRIEVNALVRASKN